MTSAAFNYARTQKRTLLILCVAVAGVIAWSWIGATDRTTWWLESFPIFLALPVLVLTRRRFPLTTLAYILIAIHACILLVGAHYTYAQVPLFNSIRDRFHLQRNDYDKVGHFAQGFVPAILAREIFIRRGVIATRAWRFFLVAAVCLAISACYEFIEWFVAVLKGTGADAFLGTQGDPFDTQSDMFCALIGAIVAQLTASKLHDSQLAKCDPGTTSIPCA